MVSKWKRITEREKLDYIWMLSVRLLPCMEEPEKHKLAIKRDLMKIIDKSELKKNGE